MKRIVVISLAVAAVAGSGIGVLIASPASASSAAGAAGVVGAHATPHAVAAGPINSGAVYTYYDQESGPSYTPCEVLTFGTKTFAGGNGDQGKYKSTSKKLTVTFQNSAYFYGGVFTGTFESATSALTGWQQYGGSFKLGSTSPQPGKLYGPAALVQGSDPWAVGGCSS